MPAYGAVFNSFLREAVCEIKELTTWKLMGLLITHTKYGNEVIVNINTLAKKLNVTPRMVMFSLKRLVHFNVLMKYKNEEDGRVWDYFFNPVAVWKGSSEKLHEELAELKAEGKDLNLFGKNLIVPNKKQKHYEQPVSKIPAK